ncbi:DUF5365 family protein [Lederbergia citri]|uniref:DUF5365 family protein n=1 Tax=Lederbergia citri TaxID=2833580 RepID=A0A942T9D7_9BACI|nr:DUF5365 family protein [Lederbergia citri]MBS4193515.1 DUF5365 family protein [Lederbergia citri]
MKVVVASTEEQGERLEELIQHFYSVVFPQYFDDNEISEFIDLKILQLPNQEDEPLFTLDGAFRAICSMEVIMIILESNMNKKYTKLFNKNVEILKETGLFFPFTHRNFTSQKSKKVNTIFSMFSNSTNQLLM